MTTNSKVAMAAALMIGFAGAAQAGEGSVDSNNFGNSYYGWSQPGGAYWGGYAYGGMSPGYSYGLRSYDDDGSDTMTGYRVPRSTIDPDGDDDAE